jgi:hypothetical protein
MELREIKSAAKVAAEYLSRDGVEVQQSKMLEAFSRGFVGRNWATFRATLKTSGFVIREAEQDPAVALADTIRGLLAALDAPMEPESGDDSAVGYKTQVYKSQGQSWLSILEGLQGIEASRENASAPQGLEPVFGTGMDFSHVEPGLHTLVAVCDDGQEVSADALVNYHTGQIRLTGSLAGIGDRKVHKFYVESENSDDSVTRYLVHKVGAASNYSFARNQDFCRFQKAFSWMIEAYRKEEPSTGTILPPTITGKILVRCEDKTESEIPAFLDPITHRVELLTYYGCEPFPEGPYEWAKFVMERKEGEHSFPAVTDEDGDWFVDEWHVRQIIRTFY